MDPLAVRSRIIATLDAIYAECDSDPAEAQAILSREIKTNPRGNLAMALAACGIAPTLNEIDAICRTPVPSQYFPAGSLPTSVPAGQVLAHNHVLHTANQRCGDHGFRAWTWAAEDVPEHFTEYRCGWSGFPHVSSAEFQRKLRARGSDAERSTVRLGDEEMDDPPFEEPPPDQAEYADMGRTVSPTKRQAKEHQRD
jgi:hypothetical protein